MDKKTSDGPAAYNLFSILGTEIKFSNDALIGSALLWALLIWAGRSFLSLSWGEVMIGGGVAVLLHWDAAFFHQLGHIIAARNTGYPMRGVRLGAKFLLSISLYPADEPELPAATHIRRALGGPLASLSASLATGLLALLLQSAGGVVWYAAVFWFLDNLLIFTIAAMMPLGFTDGSTILYYRGKK